MTTTFEAMESSDHPAGRWGIHWATHWATHRATHRAAHLVTHRFEADRVDR